jgi:2-succinyl-5-enolpyruvyl-6-hydroxy-3-cyclohexene-1-carboxylate synthase
VVLGEIDWVCRDLKEGGRLALRTEANGSPYETYREAYSARLTTLLSEADGNHLGELEAARAVLRAANSCQELLLGNSLPIRLAAWVAPLEFRSGPRLHTARGANGIDGWLAAAAGTAAGAGSPTVAFVGDVTAAHDLGGLALVARSEVPLVVAVLDNGGGRIFEHLPARKLLSASDFEYWSTPPQIDWESAARTWGAGYRSASTVEEIGLAMSELLQRPQGSLLHIRASSENTQDVLARLKSGVS